MRALVFFGPRTKGFFHRFGSVWDPKLGIPKKCGPKIMSNGPGRANGPEKERKLLNPRDARITEKENPESDLLHHSDAQTQLNETGRSFVAFLLL